jgi:hypothetical protein
MRSAVLALTAFGVLASGCGPAPPPFHPIADVKTICSGVLDPAAMTVWNAVGWIDTPGGTEEIYPKTDEEWLGVRNAAVTVAESGNLLMMEPRAKDTGEWMRLSRALVDMGDAAVKAADAKDRDEIFSAGGDLYEVCSNCHAKYNPAVATPAQAAPPTQPGQGSR